MFSTVNRFIRDQTITPATDPAIIPAKLNLEGLGVIDYTISREDMFGGQMHLVVPNDPNRTWTYRRVMDAPMAPAPVAPAVPAPVAAPQGPGQDLRVGTLLAALVGAIVGLTLMVTGICIGNMPLFWGGTILTFGSLLAFGLALPPAREQQPARA